MSSSSTPSTRLLAARELDSIERQKSFVGLHSAQRAENAGNG